LDDVRKIVFKYIFCKLKGTLNSNDNDIKEAVEESQKISKNNNFWNYLKHNNSKEFVEDITKCNELEQKAAKDYYFSILHRLGGAGPLHVSNELDKCKDSHTNCYSYFVSTSKSRCVACNFARKDETQNSFPIIIWYWIYDKENNKLTDNTTQTLPAGLPTLHKLPFSEEDEVRLLAKTT